jgi:hypothetical protein
VLGNITGGALLVTLLEYGQVNFELESRRLSLALLQLAQQPFNLLLAL